MSQPSSFRTVVFDCDSTLTTLEGIDELAGERAEEVRRMTDAAMAGGLPLEAVYERRLEIVRPSRARLDALGERYIETLVPDAREVVRALLDAGVDVRIVSGGLRPPVLALGRHLGLRDDAIAAVEVRLDVAGEYAGYDTDSPLTRSGGKRELLELWLGTAARPALLVGDGATDLEARPAVDGFAAFTGVAERPDVAAGADVVIEGPSLTPVLGLAGISGTVR